MITDAAWIATDNGYRSGKYRIEQARVGMTWELWRMDGARTEALGTGSISDLQDLASRLGGVAVEDATAQWVVEYLARANAPRPSLASRFAAWLNS